MLFEHLNHCGFVRRIFHHGLYVLGTLQADRVSRRLRVVTSVTLIFQAVEDMERETRIELATNSLEGCDSTIELLPLIKTDVLIVSSVNTRIAVRSAKRVPSDERLT